jgi:NADPH:quinone reductase-like Zn-dependent oxidoreductase
VVAVGSEVDRFAAGDRVFGYNEGPFGAHAEYLVVDQHASVATIPDQIGFEQAAAGTEGAHYALVNLRRARVAEGQDLLVYGATGAIGSAAVQLAKARGARVTAVCGTAHVDLVRGLGADRVIDYQTTDFTADEQRYDFVFDAVGKVTFGRCKVLLKPGGIFASAELGPFLQNLFLPLSTRWVGGARVIFAFPHHDQRMIERLAEKLQAGSFVPVIDRSYPLDDIVEAYEYVETGQKVGNVIITM